MNSYEDIKSLQPIAVQSIKDFDEIAKGQAKGFEKVDKRVNKLYNNSFSISLELEGIERWEKMYNIEPFGSLEMRRNAIVAFKRGKGKLSSTTIKNMATAYGAERVEISFNKVKSVLEIEMIFPNGIYLELNVFLEMLEALKPARLAINYEFITEKNAEINLKTSYKEYPVHYNMCGAFLCGTKPTIQTEGTTFNTKLNVNTNKTNTTQRYNMTGTFKSGGGKS